MIKTNYLIINRHAQSFAVMKIAGSTAVFIDDGGRPLDYGVLPLGGGYVYAALCCEEVNNITFVTDRRGEHDVITVLWKDEEGFREGLSSLEKASGIRFSRQEKRINRYAESVAEKLDEGVRLRITDAADEGSMIKCPECGMLNPEGTPYCMECGADLP